MPDKKNAHEQFKQGARLRTALSFLVAVCMYVGIFYVNPGLVFTASVPQESPAVVPLQNVVEVTSVQLDTPVPDAPRRIAEPKMPTVAPVDISEDITIPKTTLQERPVLPPPPPLKKVRTPAYMLVNVAPRWTNRDQMERLLSEQFPYHLRRMSVSGATAQLHVHLDKQGRVIEAKLSRSSGHEALDALALKAADRMEFTPAISHGRPVRIWTIVTVRFQVY